MFLELYKAITKNTESKTVKQDDPMVWDLLQKFQIYKISKGIFKSLSLSVSVHPYRELLSEIPTPESVICQMYRTLRQVYMIS